MNGPEKALAQRIKELRRRHFGPRGKDLFAQRLGLPADEIARYERGGVPPGEVMVRMCELTGEDLQWLLTGVAARGTVVISGTRGRHQDLLARLAQLLDRRPELATPVGAFIDLLAHGEQARAERQPRLPEPPLVELIPILEPDELPLTLPEASPGQPQPFDLARLGDMKPTPEHENASVTEPAMVYEAAASQPALIVTLEGANRQAHRCIHSAHIAQFFPQAFAVRLADDRMKPMFLTGDAALVSPGVGPKIGQPVLCRVREQPTARCRIWLGDEDNVVHLGRVEDGETEHLPSADVLWSLEVLFRIARAA